MLNVIQQAAAEYQDRARYWAQVARDDVAAGRLTIAHIAQQAAAHESRMARRLMDIE